MIKIQCEGFYNQKSSVLKKRIKTSIKRKAQTIYQNIRGRKGAFTQTYFYEKYLNVTGHLLVIKYLGKTF